MIIEPKVRGFICTTAHPAGCREHVKRQIDYILSKPRTNGAKKVLVVGASAGYGLASRISAAFSCGAATIGVAYEKPASGNRTATAGWYNTAAFEEFAHAQALYAKTLNADAFSQDAKRQAVEMIRRDLGKVDQVIYSLGAPRRTMADGTTYSSVLKTTGAEYTNKTIDLKNRAISPITIPQATEEEIEGTVKVMGGEDWMDWIRALHDADVLAPDAVTVAYSYIGPELTHPMYLNGSIGMAKRHLKRTADQITEIFPGVKGYISVNKGLVTQSSAAIPIVPLYISILYKVMKEKGLHEGCIEQMYRLYHDCLAANPVPVDGVGLIRLDDWEMRGEVQSEISALWDRLDSGNVEQLADIDGYWQDFYELFGFGLAGVDYASDTDPAVQIPSLAE